MSITFDIPIETISLQTSLNIHGNLRGKGAVRSSWSIKAYGSREWKQREKGRISGTDDGVMRQSRRRRKNFTLNKLRVVLNSAKRQL